MRDDVKMLDNNLVITGVENHPGKVRSVERKDTLDCLRYNVTI
ncbi:hypothetical protein [Desulfobacter sp.]